ncbi:hypothetical protein R1sor_002266 [Riccia sorocarpa]|uniref:Uncharacterized protein n=1 Tax=Riccia sorocarpa TaxID=122646 RepID=A0ABD3H4A5_9MARC
MTESRSANSSIAPVRDNVQDGDSGESATYNSGPIVGVLARPVLGVNCQKLLCTQMTLHLLTPSRPANSTANSTTPATSADIDSTACRHYETLFCMLTPSMKDANSETRSTWL